MQSIQGNISTHYTTERVMYAYMIALLYDCLGIGILSYA